MTLATEPADATIPQYLPDAQQACFVVMGQRIKVRVTPAQTGGACMVFDAAADPGMGVPTHVHDHEDELFVIRRGTVRFVVYGREIVARPGDSVFGPRGVPHAWEAIGNEVVEIDVTILPGNLEAMFRDLGALTAIDPAKIGAICADHGVRFI